MHQTVWRKTAALRARTAAARSVPCAKKIVKIHTDRNEVINGRRTGAGASRASVVRRIVSTRPPGSAAGANRRRKAVKEKKKKKMKKKESDAASSARRRGKNKKDDGKTSGSSRGRTQAAVRESILN